MGSAIHQEKQMTIEPRIVELFIDLMCRFRPNEVHNYIKMNEGYRLEQTLEASRLCTKYSSSVLLHSFLQKWLG